MTPPDGKEQVLVHIPEWDYNWQESYFFKEPIPVKAGTVFEVDRGVRQWSKQSEQSLQPTSGRETWRPDD